LRFFAIFRAVGLIPVAGFESMNLGDSSYAAAFGDIEQLFYSTFTDMRSPG
jgi:hypothetical protein